MVQAIQSKEARLGETLWPVHSIRTATEALVTPNIAALKLLQPPCAAGTHRYAPALPVTWRSLQIIGHSKLRRIAPKGDVFVLR